LGICGVMALKGLFLQFGLRVYEPPGKYGS
jgi:hypothetical protein